MALLGQALQMRGLSQVLTSLGLSFPNCSEDVGPVVMPLPSVMPLRLPLLALPLQAREAGLRPREGADSLKSHSLSGKGVRAKGARQPLHCVGLSGTPPRCCDRCPGHRCEHTVLGLAHTHALSLVWGLLFLGALRQLPDPLPFYKHPLKQRS